MDAATYRAAEAQGRLALRSIRNSAIHTPEAFDGVRFPIRIQQQDELAAYIDVMHEERFDRLVAEMDGFTDPELEEITAALADYCQFYMAHFPHESIPIPLSGMLAQYCIVRKIRNCGRYSDILEIGPGSGLQAFFWSRDRNVRHYDQIETAEAFYLLQNLIGRYLYRHGYLDHAQIDGRRAGLGDIALPDMQGIRSDILEYSEPTFELTVPRDPVAEHFPWWQLGRVVERRYDVVTSNANLTEFSPAALRYYSALTRRVLKPDGIFLAQCVGGGETTPNVAIKTFIQAGFVPWIIASNFATPEEERPQRRLAMLNIVLLPREHPAAGKVTFQPDASSHINLGDGLTRAIFSVDRPRGRIVRQQDLLAMLTGRLRAAA